MNCDVLRNVAKAKEILASGLKHLSLSREQLPKSALKIADVSSLKVILNRFYS